jgi:hypothetical protein
LTSGSSKWVKPELRVEENGPASIASPQVTLAIQGRKDSHKYRPKSKGRMPCAKSRQRQFAH